MARALESGFRGRQADLQWLHDQVFSGHGHPEGGLVVHLYGVEGIGKTRLLRHFLKKLKMTTRPYVAWFSPDYPEPLTPIETFIREMVAVPHSNSRRLEMNVPVLIEELRVARERRLSEFQSLMVGEIYSGDGANRESSLYPAHRRQEIERRLARAVVSAIGCWLRLVEGFSGSEERLLFVFDGLEDFPESVRGWIGRDLLSALHEDPVGFSPVYLTTGRRPLPLHGITGDWRLVSPATRQRELRPLLPEEYREWFLTHRQPESHLDVLGESSQGVPGKIEALLAEPDPFEAARKQLAIAVMFAGLNPKQRRWVHALSLIDRASLEMLGVLLGQADGRAAFEWLVSRPDICRRSEDDTSGEAILTLLDNVRAAAWDEIGRGMPDWYKELCDKAALVRTLAARVPIRSDRDALCRLAPIGAFNDTILKEVFEAYEG